MFYKKGMLFCEISPTCYAISLRKEICKRHLKNFFSKEKMAKERVDHKLDHVVFDYSCGLIKTGKGIDPVLQENKAINIDIACKSMNGLIIKPGETFSFWKYVGNTTEKRGFKKGRVLINNKLCPGYGGGLCNLANTIHLLVLHSPLTVTEFHTHSDALAPDGNKRIPFSSGTSVSYNNIDFRFKNTTDQNVQLLTWCADNKLYAELRSEREFPYQFEITEENHHFHKEGEKYYRISKIYKNTFAKENGQLLEKKLIRDNHSEVMFDYSQIPTDLIR